MQLIFYEQSAAAFLQRFGFASGYWLCFSFGFGYGVCFSVAFSHDEALREQRVSMRGKNGHASKNDQEGISPVLTRVVKDYSRCIVSV